MYIYIEELVRGWGSCIQTWFYPYTMYGHWSTIRSGPLAQSQE